MHLHSSGSEDRLYVLYPARVVSETPLLFEGITQNYKTLFFV